MTAVETVERANMVQRPAIKPGDTVRVHVKVREGDKERIQVFEGMVIGMHRGGARATFTVRKVSFGQGVERIFPLHSPIIDKIDVLRTAKVRRAKLYFLRDLKGKAARMKETDASKTAPRPRWSRFAPSERWRTRSGAWASTTWPGVDEVGRGCLAGPVVAAAVVLDPDRYIPRICDSKTVTALEREKLYKTITRAAVAWGVAACDPVEIDTINIHQASLARHAARGHVARAAARYRAGGRVPHPGAADGAAQGDPRRRALHGDCRGIDRRQGHPRPDDDRAARHATRGTASIGTRATQPAITSTRSAGSATPPRTAGRSGLRPCLIGSTNPRGRWFTRVSKRDEVLRQADAAVSAGKFAEAAAILRAHEARFPGQVETLLELVAQLHAADQLQSSSPDEIDVTALLDLPRVFDGLRAESERNGNEDEAAEQLALGHAHLELGMAEDAARSFEVAARSPRLRFEAAGALARVYLGRGDLPHAIEWFERAAETPSPDVEASRALLYDLGATLERAGEPARALAVFMELMAQTKKYRDVAQRVARLSREATGG